MKIVVDTQYCENYGDTKSPYWKFKGGDTYIVATLSAQECALIAQSGKMEEFVQDRIKAKNICHSNPMSKEYVLNWSIEEDDYELPFYGYTQ